MTKAENRDATVTLSENELAKTAKAERHPLADEPAIVQAVRAKLAHPSRQAVLEVWTKAVDRLAQGDTDGAITTARTLLESICKLALRETGTSYVEDTDLPKLYGLAASALGISPGAQTGQSLKSIFGAATTLVRCVGELRNQVGDAHGKAEGKISVPHSQADLAVNVSGAVARFMMTAVESYIRASKRIDSKGRVILKFDKSLVWRLRDHAHNAPTSLPSYEGKNPKPALWLVGDAGIYLMSNGSPPMSREGDIFQATEDDLRHRLIAPAEGCDPHVDEVDDWWPIHKAIAKGNDFVITVELAKIDAALQGSDQRIFLLVSRRSLTTISDVDFKKRDRS